MTYDPMKLVGQVHQVQYWAVIGEEGVSYHEEDFENDELNVPAEIRARHEAQATGGTLALITCETKILRVEVVRNDSPGHTH